MKKSIIISIGLVIFLLSSSCEISILNTGVEYYHQGQYDKALQHYNDALRKSREAGNDDTIVIALNNIGLIYESWGQWDKALEYFNEALGICRKINLKDDFYAAVLVNTGGIFKNWYQFDKALEYYNEALEVTKNSGDENGLATISHNIGIIYSSLGQFNKALKYFNNALKNDKDWGREDKFAIRLNMIAIIYGQLGQDDKALICFNEALNISRELGQHRDVAAFLNNIGSLNKKNGQDDKALICFNEALEISQQYGLLSNIPIIMRNIGSVYYQKKIYNKAIKNFNESINIIEKLRITAKGDMRRDYLANEIHAYQYLISAYIRNNDLPKAFIAIEQSRAKLLAERIVKSESKINIPSVNQIQKDLPKDTAIITYANIKSGWKTALIVITKNNIYGTEISYDSLVTNVLKTYKKPIKKLLKTERGIIIKCDKQKIENKEIERINIEDIIYFYRNQIINPLYQNKWGINGVKKSVSNEHNNIDRMLYDFLIKPLSKHIKNKEKLIIVPDGILGFLPFETLIDENGKYLVENYNIVYTQSISISSIIKKRIYGNSRKSLLAFGGAIYNDVSYSVDMIRSEKQLKVLEKNIYASLKDKRSVRDFYASLDKANWTNLPGTLSEVKNIAKTVHGSKVYTGNEVAESYIKQLSKNGDLAKYRIIHFATHGIVVPEIPELSAIVLSQFKNELKGEDGYLRMGEIAELNIKADFVNLSACETGLGKIYSGEGAVGLTQSFLIAGANGLSVSLWQVADISTSKFMVTLYELVEKRGIGYDEAINEVKRQFIRGDFGDEYSTPYYWAPFVYYGNPS